MAELLADLSLLQVMTMMHQSMSMVCTPSTAILHILFMCVILISLLYDEGIIRQPKWGHLKDVHKAIKLCEDALIATDPKISSLGPNIEV